MDRGAWWATVRGVAALDTTKRLHFTLLQNPTEASRVVLAVKNPPAKQEPQEVRARSPGQEDLLEEEMATHSNILAWKISKDRGAWWATNGVASVAHDLATKPPLPESFWGSEVLKSASNMKTEYN